MDKAQTLTHRNDQSITKQTILDSGSRPVLRARPQFNSHLVRKYDKCLMFRFKSYVHRSTETQRNKPAYNIVTPPLKGVGGVIKWLNVVDQTWQKNTGRCACFPHLKLWQHNGNEV